VQKGVATPEGVDEVVKSSLAPRLLFTGPLEQRDFNGLDTHLSIASYLYEDLENTRVPLKILSDKVAEGKLGLKTGEGFYDWRSRVKDEVNAKKNQDLIDVLKFLKNREKHNS
ncbi:MAG: 3-hydroxyacyl-CoA dehydrogenase family protein, partial [Sporomusa sp.]